MRSSASANGSGAFWTATRFKRIGMVGRSAAAITLVPESGVEEADSQEPCALPLPEPAGSPAP